MSIPLLGEGGAIRIRLISDIASNDIYKWTSDGKLCVFLPKAGFSGPDTSALQTAGYIGGYNGRFYGVAFGSNGIAMDLQGRIIWCAQGIAPS
jgi:hypothetical protein